MEMILLMAGSITHAQRMAAALERAGIRASLARAPEGTDPRGCGYGVRIARQHLARALDLLRRGGIAVRAVYRQEGRSWQEVAP